MITVRSPKRGATVQQRLFWATTRLHAAAKLSAHLFRYGSKEPKSSRKGQRFQFPGCADRCLTGVVLLGFGCSCAVGDSGVWILGHVDLHGAAALMRCAFSLLLPLSLAWCLIKEGLGDKSALKRSPFAAEAAKTPQVDVEETSRQQAVAALPFLCKGDRKVYARQTRSTKSSFTLLGVRHGY